MSKISALKYLIVSMRFVFDNNNNKYNCLYSLILTYTDLKRVKCIKHFKRKEKKNNSLPFLY